MTAGGKNNLIGISGKIGSGKDTVGKILQVLGQNIYSDLQISDYINGVRISGFDYQIKKFAGKLKDIACLLLGCTREQLEDREFKEKELGEEWWFISKPEIGMFIPYTEDNWAAHGDFEENLVMLTPRKLLQLLGTEAGREIIHPNVWINALFADYNPLGFDYEGHVGKEIKGSWIYPSWIITDVRFSNEAKAIKDRGGIVIRIERPGGESHCGGQHASETALDNYNFDYVIDNEGSIDELIEKIKQLKLV